mgnify:CR=1|jgi:hypothetical protein
MRRWVLMGGWRDAIYYREPTKDIISDSPIGYYCGVLEEIACVSPVTLGGKELGIY